MVPTLTVERRDTRVDLLHRISGRIDVSLLWHPDLDVLTLRMVDYEAHRAIELGVPRDRAMYAFDHPFPFAFEQGAGLPC